MDAVEAYILYLAGYWARKQRNGTSNKNDSVVIDSMTFEDIAQELRICALQAYRDFDPAKWDLSTGPESLKAFVFQNLKWHLRTMTRKVYQVERGNKSEFMDDPESIFSGDIDYDG